MGLAGAPRPSVPVVLRRLFRGMCATGAGCGNGNAPSAPGRCCSSGSDDRRCRVARDFLYTSHTNGERPFFMNEQDAHAGVHREGTKNRHDGDTNSDCDSDSQQATPTPTTNNQQPTTNNQQPTTNTALTCCAHHVFWGGRFHHPPVTWTAGRVGARCRHLTWFRSRPACHSALTAQARRPLPNGWTQGSPSR